MESLINEGKIYCNTIDYFREVEQKTFRKDYNDGASNIEQIVNLDLFKDGIKVAQAPSAQLYFRHPDIQGNIYCIYGVESTMLDLTTSNIKSFDFNLNNLDFGDTAVLILDPSEFLKRIKKEAETKGYNLQSNPVIYYDERTHRGELGPFYKSSKYQSQNEFRFWIPNRKNKPIILKIGSITNIAKLISKTDLVNLRYGSNK